MNFTYYNRGIEFDHINNNEIYSDELHNFLKNLGERDYYLYSTKSESGAGIMRLFKPNIYLVPEQTNPEEATAESKAVLAHEFSHMRHMDNLKVGLIGNMCIFIISSISVIMMHVIGVFILAVFGFFTTPIILNYFHHKFEYRADRFATEAVNERAVQNRLRRNTHLYINNYPYIPYSQTHPDIESRMDEINERKLPKKSE